MSDLSPDQCRAARGLVGMTQTELADESGVSLRSIAHFEAGERQPIAENLAKLRTALEARGVAFIAENGGGAGVRFAKLPRKARAR